MTVPDILRADADTYARKAASYAPVPEHPWENFEFAAMFAARVCRGLAEDDPRRACTTLMGVKISRLMTLGLLGDPGHNEPVIDTLGDDRVYHAILQKMQEEMGGAS